MLRFFYEVKYFEVFQSKLCKISRKVLKTKAEYINPFPANNKYICSHQKLYFSEVGVGIYSLVLQTVCSYCTKVNVTEFE